jgi:hypothetical protein
MTDPPFTDNYRFTGPDVAISCKVEYDREQERYIARGGDWTGFSARSEKAAALNCFRAWMLDEGGFHESHAMSSTRSKD